MSNIAMICSGGKSKKNVGKTLLNAVSIDQCFKDGVIDKSEKEKLYSLFPNGYFNCWGVKDGEDDCLKKQFEKMEMGDLFIGSNCGSIDIKGKVAYIFKESHPQLSEHLWEESIYKWIWVVKDIELINAPMDGFNRIMGYKANYIFQGLNVRENCDIDAVNNYLERF